LSEEKTIALNPDGEIEVEHVAADGSSPAWTRFTFHGSFTDGTPLRLALQLSLEESLFTARRLVAGQGMLVVPQAASKKGGGTR